MVPMKGVQRQPGKQAALLTPVRVNKAAMEQPGIGALNRCALDICAEGGRHGAQVHRHERRRVLDQRLAAHLRGRSPVVRVSSESGKHCAAQA